MKKLSNTEADLKKSVAYIKKRVFQFKSRLKFLASYKFQSGENRLTL